MKQSKRLIPETVTLSAKRSEWGEGSSSSAEFGVTFAVPGCFNELKDVVQEVYREQYKLDLHLINTLMLKAAISGTKAQQLKKELADRYRQFFQTEVSDGSEDSGEEQTETE